MTKPVILTGLRANNDLTLGNYFGGILPMISMAESRSSEYQINMFIPDLHSFTTPINHDELYEQILHNARLFIAAGLPLDNPDIYLYRQSYVPAHSEMTWILDCFTGFGEMNRMTQFKEKTEINTQSDKVEFAKRRIVQLKEDGREIDSTDSVLEIVTFLEELEKKNSSVGLFNYPVLMAADILLYGASYVPVGDDQTQHLEFTRDIAERMNKRFGDVFVVPKSVKQQNEFFGNNEGLRIKDLVDPSKKMSKSDESGKGVIYLGDEPEAAAKKIMGATTDDKASIAYDRTEQPGITNLLDILALLRNQPVEQVTEQFAGQERYGDFKKLVATEVVTFLSEFQARLQQVDDRMILDKLAESEAVMNAQANATLLTVQQAVGLRPKG